MRFLILIKIILRNLLRQRRRALIAILSVAFGVAALAIANGYIQWMFVDFREATIESQYAHVQVTRPGYHDHGRADPMRYLLPEDDRAAPLAELAQLRAWGPRLHFTGLLSRGETTLSFVGEGFDPASDLTGDRSLRIVAGERLADADRTRVMLGRGLATQLGAQPGDAVVVLVDNPGSGLNAIEATVGGIFESVSKAYDDSAILVHIEAARTLLRTAGSHAWLVYLHDTGATAAAAAELRGRLDGDTFEVRTWDQLAEFYTRAVDLFRQQLDVVRFIVVAIILLGIGNTMMMSVMERTGEIGTMMALGVRRGGVLRQFVAEGALIGVLGGLAGLALAALIGVAVDAMQIQMPPPPGLTRGYVARVLLTPGIVAEALAVALLTTMLASLYPAWKASRMAIVDAIRQNK